VRDAIAGALDSMTLADLVPAHVRSGASAIPGLTGRTNPAS